MPSSDRGVLAVKTPYHAWNETILEGVTEYAEGYDVLLRVEDGDRKVIVAKNEGGYNETAVDLDELIVWLRDHGYLDD